MNTQPLFYKYDQRMILNKKSYHLIIYYMTLKNIYFCSPEINKRLFKLRNNIYFLIVISFSDIIKFQYLFLLILFV